MGRHAHCTFLTKRALTKRALTERAGEMHRMRHLRFAILLLSFVVWATANTAVAQGKCEPGAVAKKYPALAGKTIIVAQAGEGAPFSFRDPKNFETLLGFDPDIVRAAVASIGVKMDFKIGARPGLLPPTIPAPPHVLPPHPYYPPPRAHPS